MGEDEVGGMEAEVQLRQMSFSYTKRGTVLSDVPLRSRAVLVNPFR